MKKMIEKSNPLPKYYQLENIILQDILAKKSVPGVKVATEFELRDRYKVSLNTVKKALSNLVDKGILIRERGRGTFLSKVPGKTALVKPTKNIGIIFYEDIAFLLSDPFYSSIVMDIVRRCKDVEYDIMLSSMRNGDAMPSLITEKKVDAIILVGAFEN